ncbi:MAG: hypothetical protein JWP07_597 [Pseudonocardiales bacterium]|jgi:anti-sigma regulatory factor (Ser/Thr protein kinase)|nr:hypothetical protein [Pseudonocardiales bacterium]
MMGPREGRVLVGEALAVLVSVHLLPRVQSVAVARDFVATTCTSNGVPAEVSETATLLVSELVTNVVVHARTEIAMHIRPEGQRLRVEVMDRDPAGQVQLLAPDPTAQSGRGVHLVSVLADDWGITSQVTGKTVWFELDIA